MSENRDASNPVDSEPLASVSDGNTHDEGVQQAATALDQARPPRAHRAAGPPRRVGVSLSREELVQRVGDELAQVLLFRDWFMRPAQCDGTWVPVVWFEDPDDRTDFFTFCAMIDVAAASGVLQDYQWPFDQNLGQPAFISYGGGEPYYDDGRVERDHGITYYPFVFSRYFPQHPSRRDLLQEFELYHQAFWEEAELKRVDTAGNRQVVARRIDSGTTRGIEVSRHHLRDFLAAKRCALLRVHTLIGRLENKLADRVKERRVWIPIRDGRSYFEVLICTDWDPEPTLAKCTGKDIILPYDAPLPHHTGSEYEECESFIVGRDDQGRDIVASCDSEIVDTASGAPFLTPVFFEQRVLGKYYQEPGRYRVSPTEASCPGLWSIDIDTLDGRLVQVWLGDLGRLPQQEQHHWRSFNVAERAQLSRRRIEADILGKWPSSPVSDPVLLFRQTLDNVNTVAEMLLGEKLFLPLAEAEVHLLTGLHVPVTDEVREMDEQILALAKISTDSINVRALGRWSGLAISPNGPIRGAIDLLAASLARYGIHDDGARAAVAGMRDVQQLRSSASAHRRGSDHARLLERLRLAQLPNHGKVQEMIMRASDSLSEVAACLQLIAAAKAEAEKRRESEDGPSDIEEELVDSEGESDGGQRRGGGAEDRGGGAEDQ